MADPRLLEVRDVSTGYGRVPVLNGMTFEAHVGEIVGLLGHNGMGKTTLMKLLAGILPTWAGQINFQGVDVTGEPPHLRARRGFGYVPQGRDIFPGLTVRENLAFGAAAARLNSNDAVEGAVEDFPVLAPLLNRKGGALSGGEQQILALARALSGRPKLLLLDEPTEGVAPAIVEEIEAHLLKLAKQRSLCVVVVEQDLDFISSTADRVLLVQKGTIIRELEPQMLRDPKIIDEFIGLEETV